MHSHLVPGIDDGVKTSEEAINVIRKLVDLGYKKLITTPHIMTDYYGNTAESVMTAFKNFLPELSKHQLNITLECAAEYYYDEVIHRLVVSGSKLLTFGDRYVLMETNMMSEPMLLKEFIFLLTSQGYRPVLAHPERYEYMTIEKAEDFQHRGVLLQINITSIMGQYGPYVQKMASRLIDRGLINMLGTDCHTMDYIDMLRKAQQYKSYRKALEVPLLNYTL